MSLLSLPSGALRLAPRDLIRDLPPSVGRLLELARSPAGAIASALEPAAGRIHAAYRRGLSSLSPRLIGGPHHGTPRP